MLLGGGEEQLERRMDELRSLIRHHAQAKKDRVYLEQFRKVKKSLLMRDAESRGTKTAALQEREAYADPSYGELISALAEATAQETETWWTLRVEEWKFEAWRTQMASERVEKGRYGAG